MACNGRHIQYPIGHRRFAPADVLVCSGFLAVPLAVSPVLGDQFTAVKWYVLLSLAIAWPLVEVAGRMPAPIPGFVGRHAPALIALGALSLFNALRTGLLWGVEPLVARALFIALALCFYAYFRRNGHDTRAVRFALATSSAVVTAVGLAQVLGVTRALGLEPLFGLTASDGRSATFGNANMAAQFVGFALVFLVAGRAARGGPEWTWRAVATGVPAAAGLGYMFLVGARSALLAVGAAFVVIAVVAPRGRRAVLQPVLLAGLVAMPMVADSAATGARASILLGGLDHPLKAESLRLRDHLWRQTVAMIGDRPLGVGSGNFVHGFLPYQLKDETLRSETVVYSSPHSEVLRALAEEGLPWCALAAWLVVRLVAAVRTRARRDGWPPPAVVLAAGAAFLVVESAFQFPFSMAFGCLAAAALLGLALSLVDGPLASGDSRRAAGRMAAAVAMGAVLATIALGGLVTSDYLATTAGPQGRLQRRACDLNPRQMRACLMAAWLDARAGRALGARVRAGAILDRSPYYHPAIKLLADESLAHGDARAGCFHLWVYDTLFGGRSSEHDRLAAQCDEALLESFRSNVPVPGYDRFPLTVPAGPSP